MKLIRACILAFSMYSRIPMPKVKWDKQSMEYVFCFFPLVGIVLGGLFILWWKLSLFLRINTILNAAVCVWLPILITGGIHLDGYCDTCDALASHGTREKKLEILKDSHIGAFALIACVVILLVQFGLWCQVIEDRASVYVLAVVYALSRSLSSLAAVTMKNARGHGMLATFTDAIIGKRVLAVVILWMIACTTFLLWLSIQMGIAVMIAALLVFVCYALVSYKNFKGITGDLEGYFLQLCETVCLAAIVLAGRLVAVL